VRANTLRQIWQRGDAVTLASDSRFLAAKAVEEVAAVRKTGVGEGRLSAY